jgi:hypothetical protein
MKEKLPLALLILMGIVGFSYQFTPHPVMEAFHSYMRDNLMKIISVFALALGLGNLINHHLHKIRSKAEHYPFSYVTLISFVVFLFIGIMGGPQGKGPIAMTWGAFHFGVQDYFMHILVPLQATLFALLAFFMASAAYRSFRARNLMAGLLLGSAFIVMLGQVPVGEWIFRGMPEISQWIMKVPNTASKRGIELGVTLGTLATSLKILTGIERSWLGGGR